MLMIVEYLIPFFFFLGFAIGLKYVFNTKFGVTLPISFFLVTIITFFSQVFFGTFKVGMIISILFSLFGYYKFVTNNLLLKEVISSYGFIGFAIIYLIFTLVDFNRSFVEWDEFMHWGPMIKEMIRLDKFYYVNEASLLNHKDYPPLFSLFEAIWNMFSIRYSEGSSTQALHVISFSSIFVPIIDNCSHKDNFFKKILTVFIVFLVLFGFITSFDTDGIGAGLSSIYKDLPIAMLFSYIMFLIIVDKNTNHNKKLLFIVVSSFFVGLTKQISITLVLLGGLLYLFTEITKKRKLSIICLETLLIIILPLIGLTIWSKLIEGYNIDAQFSITKISIRSILDILFGKLTLVQKQTTELFKNNVFFGGLTTGILKISYFSTIVISLTIVITIRIFNRKKITKKECMLYAIYIAFGSVCYIFTLYILYMFCFEEEEMLRLACWQRYFNSYILSLSIFDVFLIYKYASNYFIDKKILVFTLVFFGLFVNFERYVKLLPQSLVPEKEKEIREVSQKIISLTNDGDKILVLDSYGRYDQLVFNYYLDGRYIDTNYMDNTTLYTNSLDISFWDDFKKTLLMDDYIFVYTYDLVPFNEVMSSYTSNGEYYQGILYKVSFENNQLELVYIE